jgi:hypothetical protein
MIPAPVLLSLLVLTDCIDTCRYVDIHFVLPGIWSTTTLGKFDQWACFFTQDQPGNKLDRQGVAQVIPEHVSRLRDE